MDEDLERIFYIFNQYYIHANNSPEFSDFVNSFPKNANNLEICKNILQLQESPHESKVAAADSFRTIVSNFINYFKFANECDKIIQWIIEFLTTTTVILDDIFYRDLSAAASIIFTQFYESYFKIIDKTIEKFSVLKESDPSYLKPFIQIHSEIIDAFRKSDEKTCDRFMKRFLGTLFNDAKDILVRTEDEQDPIFSLKPEEIKEIVEHTCDNLSKCIAFQKDKDTTHTNDDIKGYISEKDFPLFLFHLYEKFNEPAALDVISSYFKVNSSFAPIKVYAEILDNIFLGLSQIIQGQIGFDEKSIFKLSVTLANLSSRINFRMLSFFQNFSSLIDAATQFTIMCLKECSSQPNVVENVVSFWPNVEKLFYHQEDTSIKEYIAPKAFEIYSAYIEYLLNEVLNQESNIINIVTLDNNVSPSISPIQSFLNLNTPQIYENVMEIYQMKKKEFEDCLSSESDSELIQNVQKQIAIFIQIFIKFLQSNTFSQSGGDSNRICLESFTAIFSLIQLTNEPLSQNVLFPEIEMSFSIFISIFPKLFFGNNKTLSEITNPFYHEISRSLGIANPQMCQDIFFQRIITAIQSFYESPDERVIIINLLNKMAQSVLPSRECVVELLKANLDDCFNFLKNFKYRTLFINSLMSIIIKYSDSELYDALIAQFNAKFEALPSQDAIIMLATDIRGLFLKNISKSFYHAQIKSFFPEKMKAFVESLSSSISSSPTEQDLEIINLSLKMCKSIVSPNVQIDSYSSKRIEFGHNSANGIILFSFAAQLISIFLSYMETNLSNQEFANKFAESGFREYKCCSKILANLISSGYVPFDAFLIYNDDVFVKLLTGFIQFSNSLDLDNICLYPKTFLSLINFFKELCKNLLRIMCIQLPAESLRDLMVIIFDTATRGLSIDNNTSISSIKTINFILQFVIDEQYAKESEALVGAISSDQLGKINASLWQHLFNSTGASDRSLVSEPIKCLIQINESAFLIIKDKLLEIAEDIKSQEIISAVEEFQSNLQDALNYDDPSAMRNILISLKKVINQKVASVSFV